MTPEEIARSISEGKVSINDNEIYSLMHHLEDAMEAVEDGKKEVLLSSLEDLEKVIQKLKKRLSPKEQSELD